MNVEILQGDAIELIEQCDQPLALLVSDPPYAFGGSGQEHELSAQVAVVLREAAHKLLTGHWAVIFAASSWRSTNYMIEAVRGILQPVRIATWCKPTARTKVDAAGWKWQTVNVIAFRKGAKGKPTRKTGPDFIVADPVKNGRRAELPQSVAKWAVAPFAVPDGICLDPFAGSGTLLYAAADYGMTAIGFEAQHQK